jgi:hypothetical protein
MKKVMMIFAAAVIALGVNAQGEKKAESKPAEKKEVKASDKKSDKKDAKTSDKKETAKPAEKKDAKK